MEPPVGRVAELWRYPVKSLGGERVERLDVTARGAAGDRRWAVVGRDGRLGSGKTTRRFRRMPGLLTLSAALGDDGRAVVTFPDGARLGVDDPEASARVGAVVGEPVRIVEEAGVSHFDAAPIHLVSDESIEWLRARHPGVVVDRRRLRPNVVVDLERPGGAEAGWLGARLAVGGVGLAVVAATERCVMVTMAQPGLAPAARLLKDLAKAAGSCLGVYATVAREGSVAVGDDVVVTR